MADEFINGGELASYLQVAESSFDGALAVTIANGLVEEVVGSLYPVPSRVKAIALEAAARGVRNPQAYSSVTVGIDDYDKTVRREGAGLTAPGFYLTDTERAELASFTGTPRRRVGSIRLGVPRVP